MREAFEEMIRLETNCQFGDWKICGLGIFTDHVANRFSNRDLLPLWRRATLRAILEFQCGKNRLDVIFSDIPKASTSRSNWYWEQIEFLVDDVTLVEFLGAEKKLRDRDLKTARPIFESVLAILQGYAKPDADGDMAEPDELKQRIRQFAVSLFPKQ
jgi:hypothetical protein